MSKPTSPTDLPPPSSATPPGNSLANQPTDPAALAQLRVEQWADAKWKIAVAGVIICPLVIALPPRKLDLYTCLLMTTGTLSAYHLAQVRWGTPSNHIQTPKAPISMSTDFPTERAQEFHMEMLRQGQRKETWKEKRLREDAEKFANGESYSSVIGDYVREAFGVAKRDEEGKIVQVKPEDEGKS